MKVARSDLRGGKYRKVSTYLTKKAILEIIRLRIAESNCAYFKKTVFGFDSIVPSNI